MKRILLIGVIAAVAYFVYVSINKDKLLKEQTLGFSPKVFANSLGMVMTNTDGFVYKDIVLILKPKGGNAIFSFKVAALDTAKRLGLRWPQFTESNGKSFPNKAMQAESVTIEAIKPDGEKVSKFVAVDQDAI